MSIPPALILGTLPPPAPGRGGIPSTFNWATVTDDSPLTIRFDGQSDNLGITPDTLVDPASLAVNDRVWVQQWGKRVLILGVAAGTSAAATGAELLVTSKTSPTTFSGGTNIVWGAADVNEDTLWVRDGTNVYWTCQEAGVYGIKFFYATTGLTSGATRGILYASWHGGGTTEGRIIAPYNTLTASASTSMTVAMEPTDTIHALVQSTMTVTLSEVNLYVVKVR